MRGRTARRKAAMRWVRRNRPALDARLPRSVERYVYTPMRDAEGDLTSCPYYRGTGYCQGGASCGYLGEPVCITDSPLRDWPRARLARGVAW